MVKRQNTKANRKGMARYAIPADDALGVAMRNIEALGRELGTNQELAEAFRETDVYEARILASFVGDPERLIAMRMDLWCPEFDNWAICDAICFNLFDRSPHAWSKVSEWSGSKQESVKRTAFALLWSLTCTAK